MQAARPVTRPPIRGATKKGIFQIDQRTAHEKGNDEGYQKILHRAADHKRKTGTAESIAEDARAELEIRGMINISAMV